MRIRYLWKISGNFKVRFHVGDRAEMGSERKSEVNSEKGEPWRGERRLYEGVASFGRKWSLKLWRSRETGRARLEERQTDRQAERKERKG